MSVIVGCLVLVMGVLVFLGIRWQGGSGAETTAADPALVQGVTSVPAATFDTIGTGGLANPLKPVSPAAPLTADGKPRVLYVGAEYCPYCAAERWAVVAALSRFGTFDGLGQTTSAHADIYPDTPTLSFHGSSYTSPYLSFTGYETQSNQVQGTTYAPLDTLSRSDEKVFDTYDGPPYLDQSGSIPFLDVGGRYLTQGASYSPKLFAGLTHAQALSQIRDPSSPLSKSVLGAANTFTASICQLTNGQPAKVCTSSGVTAAAAELDQS